jgi:hypothetical protein
MKKYLLLFLVLPLFVSAQKNEQGTLRIRKQPKIQAHATIFGIYNGTITKETLLANPFVELNANKMGEILSFELSYTHSGMYRSFNIKGGRIHLKALSHIKKNKISRIFFEKIVAKIENDTVLLNNITLKLGKRNSKGKNPKLVCNTYFKSTVFNCISKKNPSAIRKIRGMYHGKIVPVETYSVGYVIKGNYFTKEITNEQEVKMLIDKIKTQSIGARLFIYNIKFSYGDKRLDGIPITLKVTN